MNAPALDRLSPKLRTACAVLRSEGVGELLRQSLAKVVQVETYLAYRVDLRRPLAEVPCSLPLRVHRATEADFAALRQAPRPLGRHAEFHDIFGLDQCYLALVGDEIAHVAWIYYPHEQRHHPTRFRRLRSGDVCLANCLTLPAFRGKGVYPATLRRLLGLVRDEGYVRCYMYVEVENTASRRGVLKAGFAPVGRSWRLRFFYHHDPAAGVYIQGPPWRAGR